MALTINGERVDDEVIEGQFSQIKAYYESLGKVSCCERDPEFRQTAKDQVAARVLILQEAERRGTEASEEMVQAQYEKLIEQEGAKEHLLIQAGLTLDQEQVFLEDLRSNLRMEAMLVEACGEEEAVGDEVLKGYYEANLKHFMTPEEVRAAHIFKNPQPVERSEEIYQSLLAVRKRALAGEDFMELAREASDKPEEEVDLGFFKKGDLMDEFEALAFSMEPGEISPIFQTQWGYHLAKLTERKEQEPIPFEEVREQVEEQYLQEDRKRKVDAFVEDLKKDAVIDDDNPEDEEELAALRAAHGQSE